jgi:hypothetical protein
MKKLGIGLIVASVAALTPTVVHATDTTATSEVPDKCMYQYVPPPSPDGPSRSVHYTTYDYPNCEDVVGICVEMVAPPGPSRIAHSKAGEPAPCDPIDEACDIETLPPYTGPARAVHQTQRNGELPPRFEVDIPAECEEALSEALVPAGSESGTIVWLAALLVGLGGAMVITRRAAVIRTR